MGACIGGICSPSAQPVAQHAGHRGVTPADVCDDQHAAAGPAVADGSPEMGMVAAGVVGGALVGCGVLAFAMVGGALVGGAVAGGAVVIANVAKAYGCCSSRFEWKVVEDIPSDGKIVVELDLQFLGCEVDKLGDTTGMLQLLMTELSVSLYFVLGQLRMVCLYQELEHRKRQVEVALTCLKPLETKLRDQRQELAYIFVDATDIFIGCQRTVSGRDLFVRLDFTNTDALLQRGRTVKSRCVAGSRNAIPDAIWKNWEKTGYIVHTNSPYHANTTQQILVDQILSQVTNPENERGGIVVLGTGNGSQNNRPMGAVATFDTTVKHILESENMRSWKVELWAWNNSCSHIYQQMAETEQYGHRFKLFFWDDFREAVTFRVDVQHAADS